MISAGSRATRFPALALAHAPSRNAATRSTSRLSDRWREPVRELGVGFVAVERLRRSSPAPPRPAPGPRSSTPRGRCRRSIQELRRRRRRRRPRRSGAALAAELAAVPVRDPDPDRLPGPGSRAARRSRSGCRRPGRGAGAALWRAVEPATRPLRQATRWLRRVPGLLDETRAELGLPPLRRTTPAMTTYGPVSDGLAMVATFPQLEYPRPWPAERARHRPDALRAR